MNIILKQPVKNLGDIHDVVKVKPGYARNYLLPKGMAILATDSNVRAIEEIKRQVAHKQEHIKTTALALAAQIAEVKLTIESLAGADGKIFGSVTTLKIANLLKEQGIEVDKKLITLDDIHQIGEYTATAHLHKDVKAEIALNVVRKENA